MSILGEKLHDNRFLRLIENMLKAGYLEEWKLNATYSGSPQGGIASPILSNIYLDRLDKYIEQTLMPQVNRGERRAWDPRYVKMNTAIARAKRRGEKELYRQLVIQRRALPSVVPDDPNFRRLTYVRYADDFLLGFAGPRAEAEAIKQQLKSFLGERLKLELSSEKTLITHAQTDAARFLGYEIRTWHANTKISTNGKRAVNSRIGLYLPYEVIVAKRNRYMRHGKPIHRKELTENSDYAITVRYQMEYRGLVQYYLLASNVSRLSQVHITMRRSLAKTLANKHKTRVPAIMAKYKATTDEGYTCLRVVVPRQDKPPLVATFGGLPLQRKKTAGLEDKLPKDISGWRATDAVKRMLADTCELCGRHKGCEVHHIRKMADLHKRGRREKPAWMKAMMARRRKTLVVCKSCHDDIHAGRPLQHGVEPESRMSGN